MNRIRLIARRELRERVRQRSFKVATAINLIVVLVAALAPTAIAYFQDDSSDEVTIAVIDEANIGAVEQLTPFISGSTDDGSIVLQPATFSADDARERVADGTVDAVLTIRRDDDGSLVFSYVNPDGSIDTNAQLVATGVASIAFSDRLVQEGISPDAIARVTSPPNFSVTSSSGQIGSEIFGSEVDGAKLFIAFLMTIVMFMVIQIYGTWIAQGVVEEKANRIMEIMINAATPRDLLAGKVLGIGLAALTQLFPMLITGGIAFALQPRIGDLLGVDTGSVFSGIDFAEVSLRAVGSFLFFFVFGFILYASLYAGVASMLSRQEDISAAVGPLMVFMVIGYISAFIALPAPNSLLARVVSIVPLTSPFSMAGRTIVTDVPAWELGLSIVLLVATAVVGLLIASRIYRIGVLMYGQKPSFREVFRNRKVLGTSR